MNITTCHNFLCYRSTSHRFRVITANQQEVLFAIPTLKRNVALITIVVLTLSIVSAYVIGNSITKPIINIIKHSEQVAALNVSEDVPNHLLQKKDEVGALSNALQTISVNLRNIISEICFV